MGSVSNSSYAIIATCWGVVHRVGSSEGSGVEGGVQKTGGRWALDKERKLILLSQGGRTEGHAWMQ